jgi:hypothetical protein
MPARNGEPLELRTNQVTVANMTRLGPIDAYAPARARLDHPHDLQHAQGLADRLAADTETLRELLLPKPGSEWVLPTMIAEQICRATLSATEGPPLAPSNLLIWPPLPATRIAPGPFIGFTHPLRFC